jgi:hypothetical protein
MKNHFTALNTTTVFSTFQEVFPKRPGKRVREKLEQMFAF